MRASGALPFLGIGRRHAAVGTFEDAAAEVAHHADERHDLVPRGDPGGDRPVVGGLVVLAP